MASERDKEQLKADPDAAARGVSRRGFLRGVGVVGAGAVLVDHPLLHAADVPAADAAGAPRKPTSGPSDVELLINGEKHGVKVEPRTTLLSAMRDHMEPAITGPKLVCNAGTCGACTVLLDGKPVYSCMVLAVDALDKKITTVEGIGTPDKMSPIQAAFVEKDALMCGFCTPGFITTLTALLDKNPNPNEQQVREACKGNFCRCGTYPHIFEAALATAAKGAAKT